MDVHLHIAVLNSTSRFRLDKHVACINIHFLVFCSFVLFLSPGCPGTRYVEQAGLTFMGLICV